MQWSHGLFILFKIGIQVASLSKCSFGKELVHAIYLVKINIGGEFLTKTIAEKEKISLARARKPLSCRMPVSHPATLNRL